MSVGTPIAPVDVTACSPEVESGWRQNFSAFMDEHVRPGMPAEVFVYGLIGAGVLKSCIDGNTQAVTTVMQGLAGATAGNTISATVNHKQAAHGSVVLSPVTNRVLRTIETLEVGLHPHVSAPAHIEHHESIGSDANPHLREKGNRWDIFWHIRRYIKVFGDTKPDRVAAHQNEYTTVDPLDAGGYTVAGVAGTHLLVGEALNQPVSSRLMSAAIQAAGEYLMNVTFTADSHGDDDEPINVGLTPLTSIVMGGENNHKDHHERPWDPRHSKWDPSYALIWLLEKAGLATVPARDTDLYLEKHPK